MIVRIVHLHIVSERIADFEAFVLPRMARIRMQAGCQKVDLFTGQQGHFFTLSHWDAEKDIEAYRQSSLFAEIWPAVKPWFAAKVEAWTMTLNPE